MKSAVLAIASLLASMAAPLAADGTSPFLVVLGTAQDGGYPQAGDKASRAWEDLSSRRLVSCLGLVDPRSRERWLFDATPHFPDQLHALDRIAPVEGRPGLQGIFLTHAHVGHYLGLAHLGHEVIGARDLPVFAMPRFAAYLRSNGPWNQLVRYRNIALRELEADSPVELNSRIRVTPFLVPHRQEYSEVVGYEITGPSRKVLYIPDIDSWEEWDAEGTRIEDRIAGVDVAYLDGSFYSDGEIPGRDMSGFPHPWITQSMSRFASLPGKERAKIRFIHLNHTNPALRRESPERRRVEDAGFRIAEPLERVEI